jgi:peptide/nickel transport system permease protein
VIRNGLPVTVWQIREDCSQRYPLHLFARSPHYRYKLLGLLETDLHLLASTEAQAPLFLLGTDGQGRDLLSRILTGSRISLGISMIAVLLGLALAIPMGALSGYFGGKVDTVIQRVVEGTLTFPRLALLLVLASAFRGAEERLLGMVALLALVGWAPLARMLRAQTLALREEGFIEAAHALGAGHLHILRRHILPLVASTIIVSTTLTLPNLLMLESFLSYLGYGVPETLPSWGLLLNELRDVHLLPSRPWLLSSGVGITLTALACTILGEALQARFDHFRRTRLI